MNYSFISSTVQKFWPIRRLSSISFQAGKFWRKALLCQILPCKHLLLSDIEHWSHLGLTWPQWGENLDVGKSFQCLFLFRRCFWNFHSCCWFILQKWKVKKSIKMQKDFQPIICNLSSLILNQKIKCFVRICHIGFKNDCYVKMLINHSYTFLFYFSLSK